MIIQHIFTVCWWDLLALCGLAAVIACYGIARRKLEDEKQELQGWLSNFYTEDVMRHEMITWICRS